MTFSTMAIDTNEHGQLCLVIARIQYATGAVLLATTAVLFALWIVKDPLGSPEMPQWVRACAFLYCSVFAAGLGWLSLSGQPLTFDAQRAALIRGQRTVARFADVDHVEVREKRTHNHTFWRVRVCLTSLRSIDLGVQASQVDAGIAAAHVSTVLGKPVRHVIR
jgi:hypothetical protein